MTDKTPQQKADDARNLRIAQVTTRIKRLQQQLTELTSLKPLPEFTPGESPGERIRRTEHRLAQIARSAGGADSTPDAAAYRDGLSKEAEGLRAHLGGLQKEQAALHELAGKHGEKALLEDGLISAKTEYLNLTGTLYEREN